MVRGLFACLVFGLLLSCSEPSREVALTGPAMGTTYTVKALVPPGIETATLRVAIDDVLARIDRQMSSYRSDSEISRFNASPSTDWMPVSAELANLVDRTRAISEASGGALDITVAPLVDLWGFGPAGERKGVPTAEEIEAARGQIGYRHVEVQLEPHALRKANSTVRVDLNAVAPGYAVDALAARLTSRGITRFMVELGGEVIARGVNAEGRAWRIAVERPFDTRSQPYAILKLHDASVATSGEYRHYYSYEGHRYSHTIDPRTGRPVEHSAGAVVVIAGTTFEADAWATAFNVLGPDEGQALAQQRGMPVMFILRDGARLEPRMTPEFEKYVAVGP